MRRRKARSNGSAVFFIKTPEFNSRALLAGHPERSEGSRLGE
jgi:hypothetical protein